jgi:hypothetical protein
MQLMIDLEGFMAALSVDLKKSWRGHTRDVGHGSVKISDWDDSRFRHKENPNFETELSWEVGELFLFVTV